MASNHWFLLVVVQILFYSSTSFGLDWKCSDDFCSDYQLENRCPVISEDCRNETKAIVFPSLDPCNCCEICIILQDEGEICSVGIPGQGVPNVMCRTGLTCENEKCVKMENPGLDPLTIKRYQCDDKTKICQCLAPVLNQTVPIFGKFNLTDNLEDEIQCECSITAYKARNKVNVYKALKGLNQPTMRCLPNGQFDPLQCSQTSCGCVDHRTGAWDFSETKVPIVSIHEGHPKCFNTTLGHTPGQYYKDCEWKRLRLLDDIEQAELDGFIVINADKVNCSPDGSYAEENNEMQD